MIFKYIFLFSLIVCVYSSPAPEPDPEPILGKLLGGGNRGVINTPLQRRNTGLLFLNFALNTGHLCGFSDLISIFGQLSLGKVLNGLLQPLLGIDSILLHLEGLRGINNGNIIIFDVEYQILRLVTVDYLIQCFKSKTGFAQGIFIFTSGFDFGTILDLNSLIGPTFSPNTITSSLSIGRLIEYGLAKNRKICRSCGSSMCLPKIIFIEVFDCRCQLPVDWCHACGPWYNPDTCSVCI